MNKEKIAIYFGLKTDEEIKEVFKLSELKTIFEEFKGSVVLVHYSKKDFISRIRGFIQDGNYITA